MGESAGALFVSHEGAYAQMGCGGFAEVASEETPASAVMCIMSYERGDSSTIA